jgi:hypothetical protein
MFHLEYYVHLRRLLPPDLKPTSRDPFPMPWKQLQALWCYSLSELAVTGNRYPHPWLFWSKSGQLLFPQLTDWGQYRQRLVS